MEEGHTIVYKEMCKSCQERWEYQRSGPVMLDYLVVCPHDDPYIKNENKRMKLNERDVHPENNTLHFAVRSFGNNPGFVGVVLFKDGVWYSMPGNKEVSQSNQFMWIELR